MICSCLDVVLVFQEERWLGDLFAHNMASIMVLNGCSAQQNLLAQGPFRVNVLQQTNIKKNNKPIVTMHDI